MDKYGLEECKTAKDVKTAIVKYYVDTKFESLYKTNITDKSIEDAAGAEQTKADVLTTILVLNALADEETKAVFASTDTDDYKKAAYTICTNINTSAKTELNKVAESSAKWSDPTASTASDLNKWLFGEGRKEGDTKIITATTTSKDSTTGKDVTTTTYTWYMVGEDVMKLDTEHTKNAYYVFVTDDASTVENGKTGAQKAEAFYNELKDAKTAEKFAELVEKYAPGYAGELAERISETIAKQKNEDLAKWLFDEKGRTKGEITKILVKGDTTNKDKVTGCIVAMYEDENEETWKLTARDALASEELQKWYDEHVTEYGVDVDHEFTTAPDTTASETTTKAPEAGNKAPEAGTEAPETDTAATTETGTEAVTEAATETGAAE